MKFGPVPIAEAEGALVAHAVHADGFVLRKGDLIRVDNIQALRAAGITEVVVARLDPGDVGENDAARLIAEAIGGSQTSVDRAFTGRANLFARCAGVLCIDTATVDRINAIDEAVTVATLPAFRTVAAGEMIATVKIIPFAVPNTTLEVALAMAAEPLVEVAAFRPMRVGVISTVLPGLKPTVITKTLSHLADRLAPAGAAIVADQRVPHDAAALAQALRDLSRRCDLIVVFGASAIADRRDVIPAALEAAAGRIEHFGMPVDPGNLLLLGVLGEVAVIGAPGCARSPKENGFDWVLHRLLAGLKVSRSDIRHLGVGGLLMEIVSRPQPRSGDAVDQTPPTDIVPCAGATAGCAPVSRYAAVILAAGQGSRFRNAGGLVSTKLIAPLAGQPLVRHAALAALESQAQPVLVVTGHERQAVSSALRGLPVSLVDNPHFASGLASTLRSGIAALPSDVAGAVILLGDMPAVRAATIDALIAEAVADPAADALIPTEDGIWGNPILLSRSLFEHVARLTGDSGARYLLKDASLRIREVPVCDGGIVADIDEPSDLLALDKGGGVNS